MNGGIIWFFVLVVFLGWCLGIKAGEWGLKRGVEAEKENPQLLLDRVFDSIHNVRKLKSFSKESCDIVINDLKIVKVQIFNHLQYMTEYQIKDANKLSKDIDEEINRLEHYKTLIVDDRVYKLDELRY